MSQVAVWVRAFEDARRHRWESLAGVLEGLSEAEAEWQAPCYAMEADEPAWPRAGTIRWHLAHVAHCKRTYTRMLACIGHAERPPVDPRPALATLAEEIAELDAAHRAQVAAVARLGEADLSAALPNAMTVDEFLASCVRHDTWHAAQIALVRRLWRTRA